MILYHFRRYESNSTSPFFRWLLRKETFISFQNNYTRSACSQQIQSEVLQPFILTRKPSKSTGHEWHNACRRRVDKRISTHKGTSVTEIGNWEFYPERNHQNTWSNENYYHSAPTGFSPGLFRLFFSFTNLVKVIHGNNARDVQHSK